MANIVLCRIDTSHSWAGCHEVGRQSQANRIAVVSDELDADPFMKKYLPDGRAAKYQSGLLRQIQSFGCRMERKSAWRR